MTILFAIQRRILRKQVPWCFCTGCIFVSVTWWALYIFHLTNLCCKSFSVFSISSLYKILSDIIFFHSSPSPFDFSVKFRLLIHTIIYLCCLQSLCLRWYVLKWHGEIAQLFIHFQHTSFTNMLEMIRNPFYPLFFFPNLLRDWLCYLFQESKTKKQKRLI